MHPSDSASADVTIRLGIDTGGTFTDVVGYDAATGHTHTLKTPSTPDDPGRAILAGVREGERRGWWRPTDVSLLVHGTTVATNALLERRGARTVLITTRGFRDVLAIARQNRPRMYDLRSRRPPPLIPRHLRLEVRERVLPDGAVQTPLEPAEIDRVLQSAASLGAESIVVGLLHSYANPAHELALGEAIRGALPGVAVCLSHQIVREPGEYERLSTAAANGFVQPVVEGYLQRLSDGLRAIGVTAPIYVMKSSGGAGGVAAVARRCVETALSGPAGGVRGCVSAARLAPGGNLIAADVGGTSFDVAVVTSGRAQTAREATLGGLPLRTAMLDIHTIGAGGGSIAWLDAGGALRVGPRSAGAQPGPACYGRGGDQPTVTDANLVLGRLAEDSRLGGGMRLDRRAAEDAIARAVAGPLGVDVTDAAAGVLRVANAAMVADLRQVTVERGVDPRGYTLCGYGGAGPLHAAELAEELGATRVLLPAAPGVFSAAGLLQSDLRADRYAACLMPLSVDAEAKIAQLGATLADEARGELDAAAGSDTPEAGAVQVVARHVALRYRGQTADLPIDWPAGQPPAADDLAAAFHAAHRTRFGFARDDHPVDVAGVGVAVELVLPRAEAAPRQQPAEPGRPAATRDVWFRGGRLPTPVYDRQAVASPQSIDGPAIIEQDDTTCVLPPGWAATLLTAGELMLARGANE
ncbi:MAG: hydantoinase/oxoprolinase family protein [Planctomycetota bacterium]